MHVRKLQYTTICTHVDFLFLSLTWYILFGEMSFCNHRNWEQLFWYFLFIEILFALHEAQYWHRLAFFLLYHITLGAQTADELPAWPTTNYHNTQLPTIQDISCASTFCAWYHTQTLVAVVLYYATGTGYGNIICCSTTWTNTLVMTTPSWCVWSMKALSVLNVTVVYTHCGAFMNTY